MAVSRKVERELLKANYLNKVMELFSTEEDVLRVKSNEIAFPVVGSEGNEDFIVITVKVPTGANKGTEPYDGYAMAEEYEMKLKEKERKAKENAEKKKRKIERDAEIRRKKKEIAEKGEQSNREHRSRCSLFFGASIVHRKQAMRAPARATALYYVRVLKWARPGRSELSDNYDYLFVG